MSKMAINNLFGADIVITSTCNICGKEHTYRLKERKVCSNDDCYKESKKRLEKKYAVR